MNEAGTGEANCCPQCGAEFAGQRSPLGLCPACLLKLGMSDPAWTPPPASEPVQPAPPASSARRLRIPSRRVWATATVVLVGVLAASFVFFFLTPSNDTGGPLRSAVRFSLPRPNETDSIDGAQFAVSPDGTQIVLATPPVASFPAGRPDLCVRRSRGRGDGKKYFSRDVYGLPGLGRTRKTTDRAGRQDGCLRAGLSAFPARHGTGGPALPSEQR